jgi:hypothetical protein
MHPPTLEALIEALADAGEIDAGVEALDAWRAREPDAPSIVRLQARLFDADEVPEPSKRAALAPWRGGPLDTLAAQGFEAETEAARRVLARVFAEDASGITPLTEEATERTIEFEDTRRAQKAVSEAPDEPHVEVRKRKIVRLK